MRLRLTWGLRGGEGFKVEKFKIKSLGDWMVCGSQWREGESLATP